MFPDRVSHISHRFSIFLPIKHGNGKSIARFDSRRACQPPKRSNPTPARGYGVSVKLGSYTLTLGTSAVCTRGLRPWEVAYADAHVKKTPMRAPTQDY